MTDCLRLGSLSGSSLKVIAIVSMTIDHLGLYMLGGEDAASGSVTYHLMRMVGRLAFPIFAFLLVEGYVHTRDIRKYMLNLFVAAVISDIPWMLLGGFDSHNVMFTLLMGLMAMSLIDRFWQKKFLTLSVIAMIGALAEWLQTDYSWRGIFLICVLFMFRDKPMLAFMFGLPLMMVYGQYAIREITYDESGNIRSERYFNTERKPATLTKGYAGIDRIYNDHNKVFMETYLDEHGNLALIEGIYSAVEYQYNDAGNVIGHIYYDARGEQVEYPPRVTQETAPSDKAAEKPAE